MNRSMALACVQKASVSGVASLRQRLRERALDEASASPRVWMEALERRLMMDSTAATIDLDLSFGQAGYAQPLPPGPDTQIATYMNLTAAKDGKFYAVESRMGYG